MECGRGGRAGHHFGGPLNLLPAHFNHSMSQTWKGFKVSGTIGKQV